MEITTGKEKTYVVILRDKTEIALTTEQYKDLQNPSYKENDFIIIENKDTCEIQFHWRYKELDRFKEIKKTDMSWKRWICGFWTYHSMEYNECNCKNIFKVSEGAFRLMMYKLYGKKEIITDHTEKWTKKRDTYFCLYAQDLMREQKLEIVKNIKKV